jgi:hypothetical protein
MHPIISFLEKTAKFYSRLGEPPYARIEEGFRAVVAALNQTPMKGRYWMCGGVMLGYAREGHLLRHDTDIDFHYWKEDEEQLLSALKTIAGQGFRYTGTLYNNDGIPTQHITKLGKLKIEFFAAWRANGKINWQSYSTRHWNRPARQFLNQVPDFQLENVEFYGVEVAKPADHELYLSALYGDWRTPMPDYAYYIDSKAIVSREPWRNQK